MATITLSTLRTLVRQRGDWENSPVFTDAVLTSFVNSAIAELYDEVIKTWDDQYTVEQTLATVAGTATITPGVSIYKLRGLDYQRSTGDYVPLVEITLAERNKWGQRGEPQAFRQQGGGTSGQIVIYPTPAAVYSLRCYYIPPFTPLVADGDSFEFLNGYEELVLQTALLRCDQHEQYPIGERMAEIDRVHKRVATA